MLTRHWLGALSLSGALAFGAACSGSVGGDPGTNSPGDGTGGRTGGKPGTPDPGDNTPPNPGTSTMTPGSASAGNGCRIGPTPLRRLTRTEYENTVRDLLGYKGTASEGIPADAPKDGFDTDIALQGASPLLAGGYLKAAERLSAADLTSVVPCPMNTGDDNCAKTFIERFGKRAYRRPLRAAEQTQLMAFYQANKSYGFEGAIRMTLQVILGSPQFLYRMELTPATAGQSAKLNGYEVASRLSYFLWGSMPDEALFAAAEANQLGTKEQVAKQAERMLADDKARPRVRDFFQQWLLLGDLDEVMREAKMYPGWTASLPAAMTTEVTTFVERLTFEENGGFAQLLTANHSYMNKPLATYLGATGPTGNAFDKVTLDATKAAGLLTKAGILAMNSKEEYPHPVYRGRWVRGQLLCHIPPPPPASLLIESPKLSAGATTREIFKQHSIDPACAGCHRMIDPIGFGLEQYDATGKWRATDRGLPIDVRGEIADAGDASGAFTGAVELAQKLAGSQQAADCMTTQMFRYANGRTEVGDDDCALKSVRTLWKQSNGNLRALLVALTQTDAFLLKAGGK